MRLDRVAQVLSPAPSLSEREVLDARKLAIPSLRSLHSDQESIENTTFFNAFFLLCVILLIIFSRIFLKLIDISIVVVIQLGRAKIKILRIGTKTMKRPTIEYMTLREKIAQTCLVRQSDLLMYAEKSYGEVRPVEDAVELMRQYQFGGVWAHGNDDVNQMGTDAYKSFAFTSESLVEWLHRLEAVSKMPFIAANDPSMPGSDITSVTTGLIIGAADDEGLARELGKCIGLENAGAGINWLWTPMVDYINPYHSGIVRPFSNNKENLIKCARAYVEGMQSVRVAACAKHFPGADPDDLRDGHIVAQNIRQTYEEWEANQGAIFQALIDSGVDTIMTAAVGFPDVDDTKIMGTYLPASFSHKIITGVLKEKMGFRGVVITDDVAMGGYTTFFSHEDLYVEFLKAGNDVLLGVGLDAIDLIERAVLDGRLSEDRINDACERVLNLKERLGLFDDGYTRGEVKVVDIKPRTRAVLKALAQKGVTLVRNNSNSLLPLSRDKVKRVRIICYTQDESIMDSLQTMKAAFERRGAEVVLQRRLESWSEMNAIAEESDVIIYVGYIYFHAPKGAPSFYGEEQWSFRYAFTAGKEKSIGISLGYPHIHYDFMVDCPVFVNGYNRTAETQEAFVSAIYGEIPFLGKSPVKIELD